MLITISVIDSDRKKSAIFFLFTGVQSPLTTEKEAKKGTDDSKTVFIKEPFYECEQSAMGQGKTSVPTETARLAAISTATRDMEKNKGLDFHKWPGPCQADVLDLYPPLFVIPQPCIVGAGGRAEGPCTSMGLVANFGFWLGGAADFCSLLFVLIHT